MMRQTLQIMRGPCRGSYGRANKRRDKCRTRGYVRAGNYGMDELYGWYHGRIIRLARSATQDGRWRARLREILAEFDADCERFPISSTRLLRQELATQIEHEILQFSDANKEAVLALALKHLDAADQ